MTTEPINKQRRLALLLADGTGDFDFVRAVAFEDMVYFEGNVSSHDHKQRAEELARYVGFSEVRNTLQISPGEAKDPLRPCDYTSEVTAGTQ